MPLVPYVLVVKSSMAGFSGHTHTAQPPLASQQRRLLETPGQCRMLARKPAATRSQSEPSDGDIMVCHSVGQVCSFSFTWRDTEV